MTTCIPDRAIVRARSSKEAIELFIRSIKQRDPRIIFLTGDGKPMIDGELLFRLKDSYGLPLDISLDQILTKGFAVEWIRFIEAAREHGWWDFQTYALLTAARDDLPEHRRLLDEIIQRFKVYVMANTHPRLRRGDE